MIETAKTRGTPGLAVDLLVIDTYTGFIQTENPATPANFKHLLNRIRSMGIAILIVHHANSENEVRGLQSKMDPFACKFRLYRDNDEPGDLQVQDYKRSGYNRDAICAMIGLEKSALSALLNKANNK